ncbi:ribonuclease H2 subunit A [Halyomorpha halys]|uniref:ribonuclease H2 subunit A n=1 Tax=Halyomorpha halys TaxID=286706 RepID=UPI0006D5132E|nr:ribonuclease H2 subunit A [Halyomorpha halys]
MEEELSPNTIEDSTPKVAEDSSPKTEKYSTPKTAQDLGSKCSESSRNENFFITSSIPEICKKQHCILGIDEAGRGPVLGPMVYGVCYCPKSKEDDLKETGCADSKTLTEEKRENIFEKICKHSEYIGWEVEVISPAVISTSMYRRQKISLNEISHNSAIGLLKRALDAGVLVTEVFVDTVGPAEKYEAKLKNIFPELSITVAKKADSTYPIVGGASICAKVARDRALKTWTFSEIETSENWGSGYPTDPVTKKFLMSSMDPIFGFPKLVRFSWSTAEKILEEHAIQVDWEEEESIKGTQSVKTFFSPGDKKKHRFFKDRCLTNAVEL